MSAVRGEIADIEVARRSRRRAGRERKRVSQGVSTRGCSPFTTLTVADVEELMAPFREVDTVAAAGPSPMPALAWNVTV